MSSSSRRPVSSNSTLQAPKLGRVFACAPVFVTAGLASFAAWAQPTAQLNYTVDHEQCPDQEQFETWVASRLGHPLFVPTSRHQVAVESSTTQEELVIALRISQGERMTTREFRGNAQQCPDLLQAAASAVGVAFDSVRPASATQTAVQARPFPPDPASSEHKDTASAVEKPKPTPGSGSWELTFQMLGVWRQAPAILGGGAVGAGRRGSGWSVGLRGDWESSLSDVRFRTAEGGHYEVFGVATPVCVVGEILRSCLVPRVGAFRSHLDRVTHPDRTAVVASFGPELSAAVPVSKSIWVTAGAGLNLALLRPEVEVDGSSIWRASPAFMVGGLGVSAFLD